MASLKLSSVSNANIARISLSQCTDLEYQFLTNVLGKVMDLNLIASQFYAIPQTKQINKTGCQNRT